MTGLEDRQVAARNILMAHSDGARLHLACEIVGIDGDSDRVIEIIEYPDVACGPTPQPSVTKPGRLACSMRAATLSA